MYPAVVRNQAKLAYPSVGAWLEGGGEVPAAVSAVPGLADNLRIQDRLAQQLKARRHERGALELGTVEVRTEFDGDAVSGLVAERRNRARELIEDFMIAANGVTARFLESKGFPSLRRVLRSPERWDRIVMLARTLGESLGTSDRVALAAFIDGIDRWIAERLHADEANANQNLPRLARLAEVWEKIVRAARDTETYNLERKPLVFSVFGWLADATR